MRRSVALVQALTLPSVLLSGCVAVDMSRATFHQVEGAAQAGTGRESVVKPPKLSRSALPRLAFFYGPRAYARVTAVISEKGRVENARVISTDDHAFAAATVHLLKASRFHPALQDGRPVSIEVTFDETRVQWEAPCCQPRMAEASEFSFNPPRF